MVNLTINGISTSVAEGTTILDAARALGITIPTLCYFEDLNTVGACRICVVEVEGSDRLEAACNTPVREGMVVHTNSNRAETARRANLELIASTHSFDCCSCPRGDGSCILRKLAQRYGIEVDLGKATYENIAFRGKRAEWPAEPPIQRNASKCVHCGRCIAACDKLQDIRVWELDGTGKNTHVAITGNRGIAEAGCVACGQCITHCPTGALHERDDIDMMFEAFRDPEITTVIQVAPATRSAWASLFGVEAGGLGVERMVACLKAMGADYVFDTNFAADLTIMEEGTELLNIIKNGETEKLPLFTSCCPGWVNHAVNKWPKYAAHLSSAKSPMQMQGAITKTWFAEKNGLDPKKIFSATLMPCTAKKNEIRLPGMQSNEGVYDMDCSLTTREFARMITRSGIDPFKLEDMPLDDPLGVCTGAGVIFGITGGVMEAALRSAYFFVTGEKPDPEGFVFKPAEGEGKRPWVEATFDLAGTPIRCAVASGLANTNRLLDALDRGDAEYDFVEIMACPGGCAGGGGQPIDGSDTEQYVERGEVLRTLDRTKYELRFSHENPVVQALYAEYFTEPCSELSEKLLHVHERQESKYVPL